MSVSQDKLGDLTRGDVASRSAAAQARVAEGQWADVVALVEVAQTDKNPSVRLVAAASASDILAKHRGAGGQSPLSDEERAQVQAWLRQSDPVKSPALLLLAAVCTDSRSLDRLERTFRDPRNIVRTAAVAAVRRMMLSVASMDEPALASRLGAWIADPRFKGDVGLELARLAGHLGIQGFDSEVMAQSAYGTSHADVVTEALRRIRSVKTLGSWTGVWASDGHDVLEPGAQGYVAWMVVDGAEVHIPGKDSVTLNVDEEPPRLGGHVARLVWAPRLGTQESRPAIQTQGHTWWRLAGEDLVSALEFLMPGMTQLGPKGRGVVDALESLSETHAVARAALACGDQERSIGAYNELCRGKGTRLHWFVERAELAWAMGDEAQARADLKTVLKKAGAKSPMRTAANALLDKLDA